MSEEARARGPRTWEVLRQALTAEECAEVEAYLKTYENADTRRVTLYDLRRYVETTGGLEYEGDEKLAEWAAGLERSISKSTASRALYVVRRFFVFRGKATPLQSAPWKGVIGQAP